MSDLRKAAQQALEALESDPDEMIEVEKDQWEYTREVALRILKAALAQPEQEPVAYVIKKPQQIKEIKPMKKAR